MVNKKRATKKVKKAKKILIIFGFTILGIFLLFVFNFLILERVIIPDPCYYHSHDTNKVFDLFYELTAQEGYHPTPTRLNVVLTLTTGAIIGLVFGIKRV